MFNPVSTYRVQFHKGFTFADFEKIIPYLAKLGVSTVYASPVFESAPGSMHGYDTVNPLKINPEIGSLQQLREISHQLKKNGIGWLQDMVPNHMAFHPNNPWLMDVLEKGAQSAYRTYFDQSLASDFFKGQIMVPFLGEPLNEVIKKGELLLSGNETGLYLSYFDNQWPVNLKTYQTIFSTGEKDDNAASAEWRREAGRLQSITEPDEFNRGFDQIKSSLKANLPLLQKQVNTVNQNKYLLKSIAEDQHYRLCSWKETDHQINFRRFFTVNSLICLNIHRPEVFGHFHQLISQLCADGIFQGLRIDHIDGLYDPNQYLQDLRTLVGDQVYIVVEKILEKGEELPRWPIQGSTGYDYLAMVNNLFTNNETKAIFDRFYQQVIKDDSTAATQIPEKKAYILSHHMGGELDNLVNFFVASDLTPPQEIATISLPVIKKTIAEFLIRCPVYRYYANRFPFEADERHAVERILKDIRHEDEQLDKGAELLEEVWLKKPLHADATYNASALAFYRRCMQFTGPLMAKGVEDTLMYTYNRFIDHNEVGDSPEAFGIVAKEYHRQMTERQALWPLAINGTSTHDTKRGEDVRARLNVLSDLGEEWVETVQKWQELNQPFNQSGAPDRNDELFIYQTLVGSYPMPGQDDSDYAGRIDAYLEKTLREGKQHSDWAEPNTGYENNVKQFAKNLLDKQKSFWKIFEPFLHRVAGLGISNSLAQVVLKFTCPGVPDVYQGCEHWDLSLVDPDNRRPVDYRLHEGLLWESEITDRSQQLSVMWDNRFNGQIKVWLTQMLMMERQKNPSFFKHAGYIPLQVQGAYKKHVLAFARHFGTTWYLIAVPLNVAVIGKEQGKDVQDLDWKDTRISCPGSLPAHYTNILSQTKVGTDKDISIQTIFTHLPLAVLKAEQQDSGRGSGILLPVFSLPSPFGTGDFGPEAKNFAELLHRSGQKYWQVLPLNPVDANNKFSPYSSNSSMAGNILMISPQLLVDDGLLAIADLDAYHLKSLRKVDYPVAQRIKQKLLDIAWLNYKAKPAFYLQKAFEKFCASEAYWLEDYALYEQLKQHNLGQPWFNWPEPFKRRDAGALATLRREQHDGLEKTKWLQFLVNKQWMALKQYCNELNIELFGDLPFYVGYDSVDVWSYPEIFDLDEQMGMKEVAGVPPDYFNQDGQLWGMPVFRWDKLKEEKYDWWIRRIRRNMELFDLIRLDHFRAFSSYWSVPATEQTAVNGSWKKGPGSDFFNALKAKFKRLPFVAEDLGDVDEQVDQLRDAFNLPGMKVLQFAFGKEAAQSPHIPHNYTPNFIAYTGTHDNNTARGWFDSEAGNEQLASLEKYADGRLSRRHTHETLIKMVMASVAKISIIPMQDLLGLDESARINTPAATKNNWQWRLKAGEMNNISDGKLAKWTKMYNRI